MLYRNKTSELREYVCVCVCETKRQRDIDKLIETDELCVFGLQIKVMI